LGAAVKGRGEPSDDNCSAALDEGERKEKRIVLVVYWMAAK